MPRHRRRCSREAAPERAIDGPRHADPRRAPVERARRAYRGRGVRCERLAADGRIQGDADETILAEADILLLGAVPVSVLEHVLSRAPKLRWIHSAVGRRGSHLDPVGPRAGSDRHERPRRLQQADRRVRRDDVAGHRPTASAAPGASARADLAAAARAGALRAHDRDRRLREHRRGGRPPAPAVRMPHPGDAPPSRPRRRGRRALRPRGPGRGAAGQPHRRRRRAAHRRHRWAHRRRAAGPDARGRLAHQHRPRPAHRRARAAAGARVGLDRRRRPRRLQRGAAQRRIAALRHAERASSRRTRRGRPTG